MRLEHCSEKVQQRPKIILHVQELHLTRLKSSLFPKKNTQQQTRTPLASTLCESGIYFHKTIPIPPCHTHPCLISPKRTEKWSFPRYLLPKTKSDNEIKYCHISQKLTFQYYHDYCNVITGIPSLQQCLETRKRWIMILNISFHGSIPPNMYARIASLYSAEKMFPYKMVSSHWSVP